MGNACGVGVGTSQALSKLTNLDLGEDDVATEAQIVEILVKHKQLLQRPLVVTADTAIIGRPKDRVRDLLS